MDIQTTGEDDAASLFSPETGDTSLMSKSLSDLEVILRRLPRYQGSVYVQLDEEFAQKFTYRDVLLLQPTRTKYKWNNHLFTNYKIICFRAMPSLAHASTASMMQESLKKAIVELISPDANRLVKLCGDGLLSFPQFCGEPDGGLAFPGQVIPFVIIEVGLSDSGRNTNGRTEHWLRRASGQVRIGISIKVDKTQQTLNSLTITPYYYSTTPSDALGTHRTDHGRVLRLPSTDLVQGQRTIKLPVDGVESAVGYPNLIRPTNQTFDVDCRELFDTVLEAVEAGQQ